jgi:hypothetical protein
MTGPENAAMKKAADSGRSFGDCGVVRVADAD